MLSNMEHKLESKSQSKSQSGSQRESQRIEDLETAAFICIPDVAGYLAVFADAPNTVSQASKKLGVSLPRLHHWVVRALEVGVLVITGEIKRAGRPIRHYQTTARTFLISRAFVPESFFERHERASHTRFVASLGVARPELVLGGEVQVHFQDSNVNVNVVDSNQDGLDLFAADSPAVLHTWAQGLRLTDAAAKALQHDLWTVLERHLSAEEQSGSKRYIVHLGLAPL